MRPALKAIKMIDKIIRKNEQCMYKRKRSICEIWRSGGYHNAVAASAGVTQELSTGVNNPRDKILP